ncbi:TetR/AcrR family transcriptional regulator C-terminal domain-containing protein [Nocardia sp. CDC160]|uniref:TetR/AcrR family transcriptional regulator C-terminal domain-containing protein n=1 Tax=Nocardia sp. CDC160 TaxID=3112166 RepID=UPI002DB94967|nr:TetR/AcrR family transcriptional regulator C-terminal domain-containing protein [Nocardia sp. CDC160]MEC3917608.1 TetR/AcrR family transcriptional regulator C-terminal domain-containing protein [Nocardia sp. CDC160]
MTEGTPPVVWSKQRRDPARRAPSVDRIVATALAIADAEGLEAVSMRRVAGELSSGTASMYRYVANRDELLDLMIDAAQGDIDLPPLTGDGCADLAALARRQRETLLRHRWLGAELSGRPALGPNALRRFDTGMAAALQLTDDINVAARIVDTVSSYVSGAVNGEVAEYRLQQRTGLTEDQWRASVGPYLRSALATGAYPALSRRLHEADDPTAAESFEFGLACVLEGVSRVARSPR